MTRQVALGAVVAFALTVIGLSVCQPSTAEVTPASVTAPAPAAVPAPTKMLNVPGAQDLPARPVMLRPAAAARPELLQRRVEPMIVETIDAGAAK